MLKPGKRDHKHSILITGRELQELKKHTDDMAESYGLDGRIDRYQGKRPIGLYRWDLDCLIDVIEIALRERAMTPRDGDDPLHNLQSRLKEEYERYYADD